MWPGPWPDQAQAAYPESTFVGIDAFQGTIDEARATIAAAGTSLAHGGEGLGTVGFNEAVAREMCAEAGFSAVRRVPMENPFNILYEIRA